MRAALLALFLLACTPQESSTPLGLTVATLEADPWWWVTPHQVDGMALRLVADLHQATSYSGAELLQLLPHVRLNWHRELLPGNAAGRQDHGTLHIVANAECPEASAFVHELAHYFQEATGSPYDPDRNHAEPGVWAAVNGRPIPCAGD